MNIIKEIFALTFGNKRIKGSETPVFQSFYGKKFLISNLERIKMVFRGEIGLINSVFHVSYATYRIQLVKCHSIIIQFFLNEF